MTTALAEDRLAALEAKLDAVSHQLDYVAAALREQEGRRDMWDELRRDLAPVTAEALERVTQELDEVRAFIAPADLLRFLKRLVRDLPYLEAMLDQVESLSQLGADVAPLGRDILVAAMARLDGLQQRGYFDLGRGILGVADQAVAALTQEDWQALAQATPATIRTVRELAPAMSRAFAEAPAEAPSLWRLMWSLRRPATRRGLARALGLVEALGNAKPGPAVLPSDK